MRAKQVLTKKQIQSSLKQLSDWKINSAGTILSAKFTQPDYVSGLVFIARIAVHAEITQHHPDITFTYGAVQVKLTTHDVKGLTKKDIALAKKISKLVTQ